MDLYYFTVLLLRQSPDVITEEESFYHLLPGGKEESVLADEMVGRDGSQGSPWKCLSHLPRDLCLPQGN